MNKILFLIQKVRSRIYFLLKYSVKENDELEEQNLNTVILMNPKNEEAVYLLALLKMKINYKGQKNNHFKKIYKTLCEKEPSLQTKLKSSTKIDNYNKIIKKDKKNYKVKIKKKISLFDAYSNQCKILINTVMCFSGDQLRQPFMNEKYKRNNIGYNDNSYHGVKKPLEKYFSF